MKPQKYSKSEWYALTSAIDFQNDEIRLKYLHKDLSLESLRHNYIKNITISTFWGLYFPFALFLLISLLLSWFLLFSGNKANFLPEDQKTFWLFINFLIFSFALGLAYKIFIKGEKCLFTKSRHDNRYLFIPKKEIQKYLKIFDHKIKGEYYYFSPLETKRLIIRELKTIDVADYYKLLKSKKVCRYLLIKPLKNKKRARSLINQSITEYQEKLIFRLAIELKATNKVIGYIGLSKQDLSETTCQIVYALRESHWHKGYATEAVGKFIAYLKNIGKKLIIGGHVEENINSGKVLLKNGFTRNPSLDHQMLIDGKLRNIKIYTIDERN